MNKTPEQARLLDAIGDVIDSMSALRAAYKTVHGAELEPAAMLEMVRVLSWAAVRTMNAFDPRAASGELADLLHTAIREGLTQ